jgi:CheY-specific phosphatase CheX
MPTALRIVKKFFPEVTDVEDAEKSQVIEVTCAMAVACKRKYNLDGVIISVKTAYLIKGKKAKRFSLPESVSREIVSFDRDSGFAAGQYRLSKIAFGVGGRR